ncbi:MAG: hypothetical protein AAFX55_09090 [Bacteroidota bacterium]
MDEIIAKAVKEKDIDILVIVEPHEFPTNLLLTLNSEGNDFYYNADSCSHVQIFSKFIDPQFSLIQEFDRTVGWKYRSPYGDSLNIIVTHFHDKFHNDEEDQDVKLDELIKEIQIIEDSSDIDKTLLIGDLNIDPYNRLCYGPKGLNSIMCRKTVKRLGERKGRKLFYNASWNLLGDKDHTPGTYYRTSAGTKYWSVLDQIMMRSGLIDQFDPSSIRVLNYIFEEALVSINDIPRSEKYSDHLPIYFEIKI